MTDRKSSKKPIEHAKKFLKNTMEEREEIRDESYVQMLKQIKENKDKQRELKGWDFFAILASCFPPTTKLYYSILNFLLIEIRNNPDKNIVQRANYIFVRLFRCFERRRKFLPTDLEITHIELRKPLIVQVHFFSETTIQMEIESYTTVRELKTNLMKKMQFNVGRIPCYCLYEICNKNDKMEERILDDNEIVADILTLWEMEQEENQKKKDTKEFRIYLKILLYYDYSETDIDSISMIYYQSVYEVINGKYTLTEKDIITLAALQLLVDHNTKFEDAYQSIQNNLSKFIPYNYVGTNNGLYWEQKVVELYSSFQSTTKTEGKLTYIDHLKTNSLWNTHLFDAKVS